MVAMTRPAPMLLDRSSLLVDEDANDGQPQVDVGVAGLSRSPSSPFGSAGAPAMGGGDEPMMALVARQVQRAVGQAGGQSVSVDAGEEEDDEEEEEEEEDQVRRLLACKRLSEGRIVGVLGCHAHHLGRKNSGHLIGEMPVLREGEPARHLSCEQGCGAHQNAGAPFNGGTCRRPSSMMGCVGGSCSSSTSSTSSLCLFGGGGGAGKRHSQDDTSSSASLDRSPSRCRRGSSVSQCSSVLSETARQQLNFDLSPDLGPDVCLSEANRMSPSPSSPSDERRPCSPEPVSSSGDDDEWRPVSRLSLVGVSPDSTLGDSNDTPLSESELVRLTQTREQLLAAASAAEDSLERLIDEVSQVALVADHAPAPAPATAATKPINIEPKRKHSPQTPSPEWRQHHARHAHQLRHPHPGQGAGSFAALALRGGAGAPPPPGALERQASP